MRFHATAERARRTAKTLRDAVNRRASPPVPLSLTNAQRILALMWGYRDWAELLLSCESAPRSPFDGDCDDEVASARVERHVRTLVGELGLPRMAARHVTRRVRLTDRSPLPRGHAVSFEQDDIVFAPPGRGRVIHVPWHLVEELGREGRLGLLDIDLTGDPPIGTAPGRG